MLVNIVDFVLSLEIGISRSIQNVYKIIKKNAHMQHARADFYAQLLFRAKNLRRVTPLGRNTVNGDEFFPPSSPFECKHSYKKKSTFAFFCAKYGFFPNYRQKFIPPSFLRHPFVILPSSSLPRDCNVCSMYAECMLIVCS